MKPDFKKNAYRWLAQAERDLDDAMFAVSGKRYNLCCFLSQQAAEKAIKAFLYLQGAEFVWGHSIAELCEDATAFDGQFTVLKKYGASLDKYYIPTRCPDGLPGGISAEVFDDDDAQMAIDKAEKIIDYVRSNRLR
ncbi:MAG: HEPN domain-containing protein [Firmicutes bacterium]|nr:HEPN domain-containing protein [Bacillota bacterium]